MTDNSPRYGRDNCESLYYYYESLQINVIQSGVYTMVSTGTRSTYGHLFKQHFNPYSLSERLLSFNYEGCSETHQFKIITELQSNVTYVLIVTTRLGDMMGNFSILASGPNNVTFYHISKSNV